MDIIDDRQRKTLSRTRSRCSRCAIGFGLLLLAAAAQAQTNPFQKGRASVSAHSIPFYTSLSSTLDKAYAELNNADHFAPNSTNTPIGRYSVSWVKRFMDNDTRYEPFLCGAPHATFATATVFSDYRSTCRY